MLLQLSHHLEPYKSESLGDGGKTSLFLEQYGQWGSAVQGKNHEEGGYENAYLMADRNEAWILETTGRRWVAKRIKNGVCTLSNQPGIRGEWDKGYMVHGKWYTEIPTEVTGDE